MNFLKLLRNKNLFGKLCNRYTLSGVSVVTGYMLFNYNVESILPSKFIHAFAEAISFKDEIIQLVNPSVAEISNMSVALPKSGGGFFVNKDGLILTSFEAVGWSGFVEIGLNNGSKHIGQVVAIDPASGLALVALSSPNLNFKSLGLKESLAGGDGEQSAVLGLGECESVIYGLSKPDIKPYGTMYNFDVDCEVVDIVEKYSGYPIVNKAGSVLGVYRKNGLVTPSHYVNTFLKISMNKVDVGVEGIKKRHPLAPPYRMNMKEVFGADNNGVLWGTLTPTMLRDIKKKFGEWGSKVEYGVFVHKVYLDSPAERSGLRKNDVVIKVNQQKIENVKDIYEKLTEKSVDATITVLREGNEVELKKMSADEIAEMKKVVKGKKC